MLKKLVAILLTAGMLAGLTGCGQKGTAGGIAAGNENAEKGRYVEKEITLPEEIDRKNIFQIGKKGENLCLYVTEEKDGKEKIACYLYKEGSFFKETPAWLEGMTLTDVQNIKVLENIDGNSYLYYASVKEENIMGHLYCTRDGVQAEDITPADWLAEDAEYHFYQYPEDIALLGDGSIAANFYYQGKLYDRDTQEVIKEFQFPKEYSQEIYAYKDRFYLMALNSHWELEGIDIYKQGTDSPEASVTFEEAVGGSCYMDFLSDGTLVVCGKNGFFKQDAGGKGWSQTVAGIYTSFALENLWCMGMTALDAGTYYALFNQDSGEKILTEYVYDPEIPLAAETVLKIYSVYDNATVKQAAAMYTRLHPEVLVEVEIGIPYEELETADLNTVLQRLNTKLLAGEGPDILVLDGLDTDSFIEKGLLADISDIVTPMSEDGTILKNIAEGYTDETGAVYRIPLKIGLKLLIGRTIDAKEAGTIEGMANILKEQKESVLGPMTAGGLSATFVPYMAADIVDGKELDKETLAEKLEYLKVIAENSGFVENYTDDVWQWNIWDIAARAGAAFEDADGFLSAMYAVSAANLVKGSYYSFENAYTPIGQIGINSGTKNLDAARDFISYALSFEVQDGDFYDGFPINTEALENQVKKDRTDYCVYTEIDIGGGQTTGFEISPVNETDGRALIEICRSVDKIVIKDKQIETVIAEALPAYINGSSSLEETVTKIERNLNMYLAE